MNYTLYGGYANRLVPSDLRFRLELVNTYVRLSDSTETDNKLNNPIVKSGERDGKHTIASVIDTMFP